MCFHNLLFLNVLFLMQSYHDTATNLHCPQKVGHLFRSIIMRKNQQKQNEIIEAELDTIEKA